MVPAKFASRRRHISFHSFDPLSPRGPRLERLGEVLRFADYLPAIEFHDADHIKRLPVIGQYEFADPQIAVAEYASHVKRLVLGWATRDASMFARPRIRSADCGYSRTASVR